MTKSKWLGSFLNILVPGLGNIYGRKIKKGILIYMLFFVVVLSLRFIAYNFTLFLLALTLIIGFWLFLIVSGYRDVERDKVYEPMTFDRWYLYIVVILCHGLLIDALRGRTLDELTPINFARIPTPSMDPALRIGDILAFERTTTVERNDVTIFWFPDSTRTLYAERCIGLPGDSLKIENSVVFVNGKNLSEIPLKFRYAVTTDGSEINRRVLEQKKIVQSDYYRLAPDTYHFFLTQEQANEFQKLPFLKAVERVTSNAGEAEEMIYPNSGSNNWNTDFYGPLYIPKKGDRIELTEENIDLYMKCIQFESESVERTPAGLHINGQPAKDYEFKENYFFMMGDNRHNSLDSRYWGLLPQEKVIGKAKYLYWSNTTGRIGMQVI